MEKIRDYPDQTVSNLDTGHFESILADLERLFPNKPLLRVEDLMAYLDCDCRVIYNWNQRKKMPPRMMVGNSMRFPKREFAKWFATELLVEKRIS